MAKLLVLCLIIGVASGATFRGTAPKKPAHLAHKEGCYIEAIKDVVPYGSDVTPIGDCVRISCGGSMLYYATCGAVMSGSPNCHVTDTDLKKPYPDCCPTVKCEDENQI